MNRLQPGIRPLAALVLAAALSTAACDDDSSSPTTPAPTTTPAPPPIEPEPEPADFTEIIAAYVDLTVIETYADLSRQATRLNDAVQDFADDPTQANLQAAANAWVAAREPWESSEGFLFGPVAFLSLDPSLDSWPLDQAQLEEVLNSGFELTPDFIRDGLNATLRGFHTVEFLLFRGGKARDAAEVTARETEYLVAVTEVLYEDAILLEESWLSPVVSPRAFGEEFKTAGEPGSRYRSQQEAILELIEGMIVIADEVGNGKISDPYTQQNPTIVESWFSWNSLTDFSNNVRSIQNAYLGGYHKGGFRGASLSSWVAEQDASLDMRIQGEVQAARDAIMAIPEPFRNNLDAGGPIENAMASLRTIVATLESDLKPLIRASAN